MTDATPGDPPTPGSGEPQGSDRPRSRPRDTARGQGPGQSEPVPPGKPSPTFGDLFWLGTGCVICIVVGGGGGYALDNVFDLSPWLTFAGLAFGVVSAVLLVVANLRRYL